MKVNISNLRYLTEGGEGTIYEHNNDIVKIYKSHVDIKSKQNRIKLLMGKQLPSTVIVPIEEVFDMKGNFIGFRMRKISGEDFAKLSSKKFIKSNNITVKFILKMLIDVKDTLDQLHNNGIIIGDLNDQNIMFDLYQHVYFIDCDSWSIGNEKATVAMDSFKDPLLRGNDFIEDTYNYSFAILAWRSLTRIHPFAGIMNPDINMIERMKRGLSIIDNPNVTIPKSIRSWKNLSPKLVDAMKFIFENKSRTMGSELKDMYSNLKYCDIDKDFYFGDYISCPWCDSNAKIDILPTSQGTVSGIELVAILDGNDIKLVLNENSYIDTVDRIVDIRNGIRITFNPGSKYYFTKSGKLVVDNDDNFYIYQKNTVDKFVIEKKFKSNIVVQDDCVYYINRQNSLIESVIVDGGNGMKKKASCANISYFDVFGGHFCILNLTGGHILINTDGRNCDFGYSDIIINYGIHYDNSTDSWLVVVEGKNGEFDTFIVNNEKMLYHSNKIKYQCPLNNLCIYNNIIFIPTDGSIRGFAYTKGVFKDFECGIVANDSKIIKRDKRFLIINDDNIYRFG